MPFNRASSSPRVTVYCGLLYSCAVSSLSPGASIGKAKPNPPPQFALVALRHVSWLLSARTSLGVRSDGRTFELCKSTEQTPRRREKWGVETSECTSISLLLFLILSALHSREVRQRSNSISWAFSPFPKPYRRYIAYIYYICNGIV